MGDNDIKNTPQAKDAASKEAKGSAYKYIGPPAGMKGKSLAYPGANPISPSRMTDAQIASLEKSNPDVFKKLWETNK